MFSLHFLKLAWGLAPHVAVVLIVPLLAEAKDFDKYEIKMT